MTSKAALPGSNRFRDQTSKHRPSPRRGLALEPVYAIVGAWRLFGDLPTLRMAAGAALIVLATILAAARKALAEQGDTRRCAH